MNGNITLAGNLTRDPELRMTNAGAAVARLSLAVDRRWRTATGEWDERTTYYTVVAWGSLGEHAGVSLHRGDRVVVNGRVEVVSWVAEGEGRRSSVEIVADEIGASLRWATAQVTKVDRAERPQPVSEEVQSTRAVKKETVSV